MSERTKSLRAWAVAMVVCALAAAFGWRLTRGSAEPRAFTRCPVGVMGTGCQLVAYAPGDQAERAEKALAAAEAQLRAVEARMSAYLEMSEISHFNAAPAGEEVKLSGQTMEVLRIARKYHSETGGAFDVTCRPILQLWKRAGKANRPPTPQELAEAGALAGWTGVELLDDGARKLKAGAGIDLGGVAKKYAIDLAAEAMRRTGVPAGLVNVGGDIRCFGRKPSGENWQVAIRDPFHPDGGQVIGTLSIREGAVCTSGNYERFVEIGGKRYSHIVDPRTAMPADLVPSVTVVGPDAVGSGVWATALSALGPDGLELMPKDSHLEAMLITGDADDHQVHMTEAFRAMLTGALNLPATRPAAQSAVADR